MNKEANGAVEMERMTRGAQRRETQGRFLLTT